MQLIQVMLMLIVYIAYVSYEEHAFSLLTQHVQLLTLDTLNNRGGGTVERHPLPARSKAFLSETRTQCFPL